MRTRRLMYPCFVWAYKVDRASSWAHPRSFVSLGDTRRLWNFDTLCPYQRDLYVIYKWRRLWSSGHDASGEVENTGHLYVDEASHSDCPSSSPQGTASAWSSYESDEGEANHETSMPPESDNDSIRNEYNEWHSSVAKCLSDLERRLKSLHHERQKAESVDTIIQRAQLLTTYMYMFTPGTKSATVQDWETGSETVLVLDSAYDSAADEAAALFDQARKLKRGLRRIAPLIEKTTAAIKTMQELEQTFSLLESNDTVDEHLLRIIQDRMIKSARSTGFQAPANKDNSTSEKARHKERKPSLGTPASNIRKMFTPAGSMLLIGRNRRGNEYLSMTKARPSDVWMHARGAPGAHILIPQSRGMPEPTQECLQLAANLAIFYSDARNERKAPVTVTLAKHVQKPRGAALGAVKLRQEDRVINGIPEDVPEELKDAREQSGQLAASTENSYRAADKAKRRKQTMATATKTKKTKKK